VNQKDDSIQFAELSWYSIMWNAPIGSYRCPIFPARPSKYPVRALKPNQNRHWTLARLESYRAAGAKKEGVSAVCSVVKNCLIVGAIKKRRGNRKNAAEL
jgi:hypothetical protein